jgi:hypothetical protein
MIVSEPKNVLSAWFQSKTGLKHRVEDCVFLASRSPDKILCVLVFHNHDGRDVEIDVPPCRLPLSLLRAAQRYVVNQLECDRVTFKFRADNEKSMNSALRLGGEFEGNVRRFYPDGCDQIIFGLLKEDFHLG